MAVKFYGMNQAKKILGFNDTWLMLIGIPLVTFFTTAMMFTELMLHNPLLFWANCGTVGLVYTIIYWLVFRYLLLSLRKKLPSQKDFPKRTFIQVVAVVVIHFVLKLMLDPLLHPFINSIVDINGAHDVSMTISSLMVTFLVLGTYETASFYFQLQKEQLEKEQLMKENMRGQLEGLKNQVNPHFFFNSLNTLAYLIPEHPAKAENFVQKLSKAYRYILEIRERETVTVAEELDFLNSYTCLLNERFGENLNISIDVPERFLKMGIVPLAMQMLFENAIKHNVVSREHPLSIDVRVENGKQLVVKNKLQPKQQTMDSTKVGLENIKRRYRFLSGKEVETIVAPQSFIAILPLLTPPKTAQT